MRRVLIMIVVLTACAAVVIGGVAATSDRRGEPHASAADRGTPSVAAHTGALPEPVACARCWHPPVRVSWDWVLADPPSAPFRQVAMYDVDGLETPASTVAALHRARIKATCYIDAGSWERYRPDAAAFPKRLLGEPLDGWPGERWLDVRDLGRPHSVLRRLLDRRVDVCRSKGFDAVELDNMDGYANKTGFPITAADQLRFDETLANDVHRRGMSVLQKNDGAQTPTLLRYFDGALDEQCNQYHECTSAQTGGHGGFDAYVDAGKPVFQVEYSLPTTAFCAADDARDFNGIRLDLDLDGRVFRPCRR